MTKIELVPPPTLENLTASLNIYGEPLGVSLGHAAAPSLFHWNVYSADGAKLLGKVALRTPQERALPDNERLLLLRERLLRLLRSASFCY